MKTRTLSIILILITSFAYSGCVELSWLPSCSDSIAGMRIYYGLLTNTTPIICSKFQTCLGSNEIFVDFNGVFDSSMTISDGSATHCLVTNLLDNRTYFFAITAFDTLGQESDFSSKVIYTTPLLINTNAGNWGGITNWPVYQEGGDAPQLSLATYSYDVQWIIPPLVVTNSRTFYVTNSDFITKGTNYWLGTNYSSSTIRNYLLKSNILIPTNWWVQSSSDLVNWTNSFCGSNSPVYIEIINQGGNKFFHLKF